jgi:hypothetical protein
LKGFGGKDNWRADLGRRWLAGQASEGKAVLRLLSFVTAAWLRLPESLQEL